jgi:phospholipid/cholesterol/gamma-HCH transport system substrate-binding protein
MENKSHALAAGAFVIFVTALVIALAAWLARDTKLRDVYEISTSESVSGLAEQAAVRYRGISVGKVESIDFDPRTKGNVLVRLAINGSAPLTQSTFAMLGFQGVTGLAYVQLDDAGESKEALTTSRFEPTRIPLHPSLFSSLSDQGNKLLVQVEDTSKLLNQLLSLDNQKVLLSAMHATAQSAEKIGAMSKRIETIADAQFGPQRTNIPALVKDTRATMAALQGTAGEFNKTAQEFNKTAQEASRAANETTRAASSAAAAVTALGSKVTEKGGVLDQISLGSTALVDSVQTLNANTLPRAARAADDTGKSARNISRVFNQLGDNPQSLLYGNGNTLPGPGEPGFVAPTPTPNTAPAAAR